MQDTEMAKIHGGVPAGIAYPFDELVETLLPHVKRGDEINKYFTSSFAFMCALVIYLRVIGEEEFDTIGVWGFEMSTDTEFKYQKGSTEFWLGYAAGLGINIYIPASCKLLSGAIYGWEASRMLNRQKIDYLREVWNGKYKLQLKAYQKLSGKRELSEELAKNAEPGAEQEAHNIRSKELFTDEMNAAQAAATLRGRVQMLEDQIKMVDMMHRGEDPFAKLGLAQDDKEATGDVDHSDEEVVEETDEFTFVEAPGPIVPERVEVSDGPKKKPSKKKKKSTSKKS
jgi:hypothetical protein